MASGAVLQAKVAKLLKRVNATNKPIKLRQVTVAGGDPLLGIGGTQTVVDTVIDGAIPGMMGPATPDVGGAHAVITTTGMGQPGDWRFTLPGTILESALRNSQLIYGDDVYQIVAFEPAALGGTVLVWTVTARTVNAGG